MVSMTDLLRNRILSYNGMILFFILHFKPVTITKSVKNICIPIVNIRFCKHKVKQFPSLIAYQV